MGVRINEKAAPKVNGKLPRSSRQKNKVRTRWRILRCGSERSATPTIYISLVKSTLESFCNLSCEGAIEISIGRGSCQFDGNVNVYRRGELTQVYEALAFIDRFLFMLAYQYSLEATIPFTQRIIEWCY